MIANWEKKNLQYKVDKLEENLKKLLEILKIDLYEYYKSYEWKKRKLR